MIIIDTREKFKAFAEQKLNEMGIKTKLEACPFYADYIIDVNEQRIGIQRKSFNELISQMNEIKQRSTELLEFYDAGYLLLEHPEYAKIRTNAEGLILTYRQGSAMFQSQTNIQNVYKFLFSLRKKGLIVEWSMDYQWTIHWLAALHDYTNSTHLKTWYYGKRDYYTIEERAISALACADGVGKKLASQILDYGSIAEFCKLTDVYFSLFSSIGPYRGKSLYDMLHFTRSKREEQTK